ncbi:MAG TPA: PAS domain S-box protein [Chitinophagaceae bacterium]|nr:PAS domain S-box protein [Chitinophagaceae bacterium]
MRVQWKQLKPIIASSGFPDKQYLTVVDEEGAIILANSRMVKELKLKNLKQAKCNFFSLLHPVHIEDFRNAFRYTVKNNSPYSMELQLKNGQTHFMKWQVSFLPEYNSKKTFLCIGHDKPEKHSGPPSSFRLDEAAGTIFQGFMKNSPNMIWVVNDEAVLLYANQVFFDYFRLTEEALNKKLAEILPLEVADALYEKHLKVLQTARPLKTTEKGKMADGSPAVFNIIIFPVTGANGEKMLGGIATNVADRYTVEKKLAKATERLSQITRITSDAIWEWDMMSGDIYRNEKLVEMTGYLPKENAGLAWWLTRVHPEDRNQLTDTLRDVTDKNLQSWESEYRFLCADGEYKNMLDRGFVLYENGMPVKMIGSLHDITSEKMMENLLLEEKLRQFRTISETAIRVQEQERTRLGREMHDNVNQILSTIKMFVGLLTPANAEEAEIKQKTIEYSLMAIEEIRKLSREMVSPQLDGGSLTGNIQKMTDDIKLTSSVSIKFIHDSESDLLSPGKKLTLFRIVQEQLKNIMKYSKAKQVEIFLQIKNKEIQLIIKDDGVGFDMKKTNSGVGLASIRDRAKFYAGKAEIESAPGKGCQLTVSIPLEG